MKKLIEMGSVLLPYVLLIGLGAWLAYGYMSQKQEISNLKWDLATMENRATAAEYNLEQEKKYQKEREDFRKELDTMFQELKQEVDSYTKQLEKIKDERNKSGVNNSLSEPVTRVLKDFTSNTNKD